MTLICLEAWTHRNWQRIFTLMIRAKAKQETMRMVVIMEFSRRRRSFVLPQFSA
jgi:hypothetical protein